ncbi:MAG: hypothetical protein JSS66_13885 [Armatimonadetes bacterium]|nr:hypothetical protein [Armatimonadota bacterium]
MAVLNLIPALFLLLVNGPVAPLADGGMPGTRSCIEQRLKGEDEARLLRFALSQLVAQHELTEPAGPPESETTGTATQICPPPAAAKLLSGFATPGRTRDGPTKA